LAGALCPYENTVLALASAISINLADIRVCEILVRERERKNACYSISKVHEILTLSAMHSEALGF